MRLQVITCVLLALAVFGCDATNPTDVESLEAPASQKSEINQYTEVTEFQFAGDFGGGVLEPGTFFPPTDGGFSLLRRHDNRIEYTVETTGLPAGAYTNWIVTINEPENCLTSPCTDTDVFGRTAEVDASVFWATGEVVGDDGIGRFRTKVFVGELPTGDDQVGWPPEGATGLQNTYGGEYHIIIKYHGPTSDDPSVLEEQLTTLTGSCEENANAYDLTEIGFGIQCFDPQVAIHTPQ